MATFAGFVRFFGLEFFGVTSTAPSTCGFVGCRTAPMANRHPKTVQKSRFLPLFYLEFGAFLQTREDRAASRCIRGETCHHSLPRSRSHVGHRHLRVWRHSMQQLKVRNFEWTDHSVQSAGPSSRITDYGQRTAQNRRNGTTPCPLVGNFASLTALRQPSRTSPNGTQHLRWLERNSTRTATAQACTLSARRTGRPQPRRSRRASYSRLPWKGPAVAACHTMPLAHR